MQNLPERHEFILRRLQEQGFVKVTDLSDQLNVSEVTIRKDLRTLEQRNLLYRTHGGANRTDPYVPDQPLSEKSQRDAEQKRRIGEAAAALVSDQDAVILASGTTMLQIARHLKEKRDLTVLTNAMNVATELVKYDVGEVILLGGILRRNSSSVVGPYAEHMLRDHNCSYLFLGVDGFDLEHGLTTANALEAQLNKLMIEVAQRTVVVTDATKFGRRGFRRICGIDAIDQVITDDRVSAATVRALEDQGVDVTVV